MNEKNDIIQIFGILMKNPEFLSQVDKYNLTLADFPSRFEKYIFDAINGLYFNGAKSISVIEIENYLEANAAAKATYESLKGREYLEDALEFSQEENFDYYYTHLKKINALKGLKKAGFNIDDFYCEDLTNPKAIEINSRFEELTIPEIFDEVRKKFVKLEQNFSQSEEVKTSSAAEGIVDIFTDALEKADIGIPLQGELTTETMGGARLGTFCLRSGASGTGKTRNMVADACYFAYPIRYNYYKAQWELKGNCEKVLYVVTEQTKKEIQRMILAYITGINEEKFRYGNFSELETTIIKQAINLMQEYSENFLITRMPDPTNELIKSTIRQNCILHDIHYVFYDYIFICPSVLKEFKGFNLRNDEVLTIMSNTLKNLAQELNVFLISGTQVNANVEDNKNIRNESSLAGGRATINKADYGFIMARPTKDELEILRKFIDKYGKEPNLVFDVYKNRSSRFTQIRIWSIFDYSILRREDLFMTDNRMNEVESDDGVNFRYENWEKDEYMQMQEKVAELNSQIGSNLSFIDRNNRMTKE